MKRRFFPISVLALWAASIVLGWAWLARYTSTPGTQARAPAVLPAALARLRQEKGPAAGQQLFVTLHPECSCSLASLHELSKIVQQSGANANRSPLQVTLLMFAPRTVPPHWQAQGFLLSAVGALHPDIVSDLDGYYAALLGASTSGEVLLYSETGRLLFQGGITPQRGHEGASEGGSRLLAAIQANQPVSLISHVFGCPIFPHPSRER